ncbi:hypothetical protein T05_10051 [Trichinella murrelli]|uniref:Uncharacterized protein n=1 Tax=Trichinella murrelli TaxID=144512 RepID=A0A0V0T6T9_9BILA|nr:hypothetical protein T05_10051 [Trichinella murrelli]
MMRRKTLLRTAAAKSATERLRKDAEHPSTSGITDTNTSGKKRAWCQLGNLSVLGSITGKIITSISDPEDKRLKEYTAVIQSCLDNGWAEVAPDAGPLGRTWYLPHNAVYQKGSSGEVKCRIRTHGFRTFP